MGVREFPATYESICDACGKVEVATTKDRPKYWGNLNVLRDAYDFQGASIAGGSIKLLLCGQCANTITAAINMEVALMRKTPSLADSPPGRSGDRPGEAQPSRRWTGL